MEQIYVESNKGYKHGFILKEQDLRRFVDLMNEQFKKLSNENVEYRYTIKFKNGAVANTPDIESVLKLDNEGSASIVGLEIGGKQTNNDKVSEIKLDFRDPDTSDDETINPVRHSIKGQSRDWVFVTSSLIEERVGKIKRKQLDPTSSTGTGKLFFKLLTPILMLALMIGMISSTPSIVRESHDGQNKALNEIEAKWKSHSITDPIDALIQIEKSKNTENDKINLNTLMFSLFLAKPFIFIIIGLILIVIFSYIFMKFYPAYNFCWGNYIEIFNKKESNRKVIIGILLGTILLGVIVNLLSNLIWEKM
jgi:hypothetical protein